MQTVTACFANEEANVLNVILQCNKTQNCIAEFNCTNIAQFLQNTATQNITQVYVSSTVDYCENAYNLCNSIVNMLNLYDLA